MYYPWTFLAVTLCLLLVSPSASFFNRQAITRQSASFRTTPATTRRILVGVPTAAAGSPTANSETQTTSNKNPIYQLLSTPNDQKPLSSEDFYNDRVVSHLHGYMLLVGLLAARDEVFFLLFLVIAFAAAGSTLSGALPANPRVPAAVAAATLATTLLLQSVVGYEPIMQLASNVLGYTSDGPAESALSWEVGVCAINIAWGLWGPWQEKELENSI